TFAAMNSALLLAEPEPSTREFLQRHLADDGFDVLGAEADREALELLERLKPSLVLSSPELCRRLREGEPGRSWDREVPVIALGRTRTLDSHSSRLRRKLRQAGAGPCVVNIWGVGYRLLDPERPPSPALPTGSERTPRPSRDVLQVGVASGE